MTSNRTRTVSLRARTHSVAGVSDKDDTPVKAGTIAPPGADGGGPRPQRSEDGGMPPTATASVASESAEGGPLDSTQSICCPPPSTSDDAERLRIERRRLRWQARATLWAASSLKAVRCCGRIVGQGEHAQGDGVPIRRTGDGYGARAGYAGLATCGSVWACPRCSAVIAAERSIEIGEAVRTCVDAGGSVYLVTLTMRHHAGLPLAHLFEGLSRGWRKSVGDVAFTGRGPRREIRRGRTVERPGRSGERDTFGVAGLVRVIEATWGRPSDGGAGWHLHIHCLIFCIGPLADAVIEADEIAKHVGISAGDINREMIGTAALGAQLFSRWCAGVTKCGLPRPLGAGFDIRRIADGGADFIGTYLSKATLDVAARVGAEVGGGVNTKTARGVVNVAPFALLNGLVTDPDAPRLGIRTPRRWSWLPLPEGGSAVVDLESGEVTEVGAPGDWAIWHEWEQSTKGRQQIRWSNPVKSPATDRERFWNRILAARGREAQDAEIAARDLDGQTLGWIENSGWYRRMVWRPAWLVEAIEVAERSPASMSEWMGDRGVAYVEARKYE